MSTPRMTDTPCSMPTRPSTVTLASSSALTATATHSISLSGPSKHTLADGELPIKTTVSDADPDPGRAISGSTQPKRPWRRSVMPWDAIVGHQYQGSGSEEDPYVVTWLEDDCENPYRWAYKYKWYMTMMTATGMLTVTMPSSILSAAIKDVKTDFPGHGPMLYIMVTSIYVLGMTAGPFLWAPVSEVFGRRFTAIITFIPFTAFNAGGCGAKTLNALLAMRFLAGAFGCSTMTNSGGIISDMFQAHQRGLAMGVFAAMPFLGPAVGPIVGGFLSQASSWRWVQAVTAFFSATLTAMFIILLPETYAPTLLRRRAARLSAATGKVYRCHADILRPLHLGQLFKKQLMVPYRLLFGEPIVFILSLYMACSFAILYMQFTAFPLVFTQARGWGTGISGLAFIPVTVGSNLGLALLVFYINPKYSREHQAAGGYLPPEKRLPVAMIGAVILPLGLIIFAWTCVPARIHWIGCLIAMVPYGAGTVLVFLSGNNYLVDSYLPNAASVMAGGTVMRSILGGVFPLFTVDMFSALGINRACTLVAGISCIFVPVPFILYLYGRRIRRLTKPGREADDLGMLILAAAREHVPTDLKEGDAVVDIVQAENEDAAALERVASLRSSRSWTALERAQHEARSC